MTGMTDANGAAIRSPRVAVPVSRRRPRLTQRRVIDLMRCGTTSCR